MGAHMSDGEQPRFDESSYTGLDPECSKSLTQEERKIRGWLCLLLILFILAFTICYLDNHAPLSPPHLDPATTKTAAAQTPIILAPRHR